MAEEKEEMSVGILKAIHALEMSIGQRLTEHAEAVRARVDDIERRHSLNMQEFQIKVWERFEKVTDMIHQKSDNAKAARENDFSKAFWFLLSIAGSVATSSLVLVYKKFGG